MTAARRADRSPRVHTTARRRHAGPSHHRIASGCWTGPLLGRTRTVRRPANQRGRALADRAGRRPRDTGGAGAGPPHHEGGGRRGAGDGGCGHGAGGGTADSRGAQPPGDAERDHRRCAKRWASRVRRPRRRQGRPRAGGHGGRRSPRRRGASRRIGSRSRRRAAVGCTFPATARSTGIARFVLTSDAAARSDRALACGLSISRSGKSSLHWDMTTIG
jgi:hypothetical protein